MIQLATFTNEMEAQLLESQLAEAGVDHKTVPDGNDGFRVMVFEDDLDLAKEIMQSRASDDDYGDLPRLDDDTNLDDFPDDMI